MKDEQRGRGYWRYVRNKTILRKKRISNSVYGLDRSEQFNSKSDLLDIKSDIIYLDVSLLFMNSIGEIIFPCSITSLTLRSSDVQIFCRISN